MLTRTSRVNHHNTHFLQHLATESQTSARRVLAHVISCLAGDLLLQSHQRHKLWQQFWHWTQMSRQHKPQQPTSKVTQSLQVQGWSATRSDDKGTAGVELLEALLMAGVWFTCGRQVLQGPLQRATDVDYFIKTHYKNVSVSRLVATALISLPLFNNSNGSSGPSCLRRTAISSACFRCKNPRMTIDAIASVVTMSAYWAPSAPLFADCAAYSTHAKMLRNTKTPTRSCAMTNCCHGLSHWINHILLSAIAARLSAFALGPGSSMVVVEVSFWMFSLTYSVHCRLTCDHTHLYPEIILANISS
jgi:hypothetical protein